MKVLQRLFLLSHYIFIVYRTNVLYLILNENQTFQLFQLYHFLLLNIYQTTIIILDPRINSLSLTLLQTFSYKNSQVF